MVYLIIFLIPKHSAGKMIFFKISDSINWWSIRLLKLSCSKSNWFYSSNNEEIFIGRPWTLYIYLKMNIEIYIGTQYINKNSKISHCVMASSMHITVIYFWESDSENSQFQAFQVQNNLLNSNYPCRGFKIVFLGLCQFSNLSDYIRVS